MPVSSMRRRYYSGAGALHRRELGLNNNVPNVAPILGGLRTTPDDEYGFWNVLPNGVPAAVPPFSISFSTTALDSHALLCTDEDGVVTILDTRRSLNAQMHAVTPETSPVTRFRAHENAIFDSTWLPGDSRIATAAGDCSARVFDVATTFRFAQLRGHTGSVKCVRSLPGSVDVVLTASRDGNVQAFDLRVPSVYNPALSREVFHKPVYTLEQAHPPNTKATAEPAVPKRRRVRASPPPSQTSSVTALAFRPGEDHQLLTSGQDGLVKVWDLRGAERRRRRPGKLGSGGLGANCVGAACPSKQLLETEGIGSRSYGIASMDIDSSGRHLAVSVADSTIYVYDAADVTLGYHKKLVGHTQTSFYLRAQFSGCGRFLASGSMDTKTYVWDMAAAPSRGSVGPMMQLEGHRGGDAACVAWRRSGAYELATCADDATVKMWRIRHGERAVRADERVADGEVLNAARACPALPVKSEEEEEREREQGSGRMRKRKRMRNTDIRTFFRDF